AAMATYLRKYSDRNATAEDLLQTLDSALGRNISASLSSFVNQPGFPLIRGALACRGKTAPTVTLAQEPFVSGTDATWKVPVCARAGRGKRVERACILLDGRTGSLPLPASLACPDWVVLGGLGYYRVAYAPALRKKLLGMSQGQLSVEEQVSIASDLSALAE